MPVREVQELCKFVNSRNKEACTNKAVRGGYCMKHIRFGRKRLNVPLENTSREEWKNSEQIDLGNEDIIWPMEDADHRRNTVVDCINSFIKKIELRVEN